MEYGRDLEQEGTCSEKADTFSFAMVMIEVRHRRSTVCRSLAYRRFIPIQVSADAVPFNNGSSTRLSRP